MSDSPLWCGYLDAADKSSAVLLDPRLDTGKADTIYLFNLARGKILEYRRDIVEPKLREFTVDEAAIAAELTAAYQQVRGGFTPRSNRTTTIAEAVAPRPEEIEPEDPDPILDLDADADNDWSDED